LRASRPLLDELCKFYCDIVGLRIGTRPPFNFFGYWLYAGDQDVLHLSEAKSEEVHHAHVNGTFDHVAFNCTDRLAVEQHLKKHAIQFRTALVPLTNRYQIFFSDPVGNGIEFNFPAEQ
jgi:catechol-2,3-dioxygenase